MPRSLLGSVLHLILIASCMLPLIAAAIPEQTSIENRAKELDKQIICPVCPGETLHQSQATLAKQMRALVREQLASGKGEEEILEYFVSVYGQSVLASPPKEGGWLLAWLIPGLGMIITLTIGFFALKSMQRPRKIATNVDVLKPPKSYLTLVDDEINSITDGMDQGYIK